MKTCIACAIQIKGESVHRVHSDHLPFGNDQNLGTPWIPRVVLCVYECMFMLVNLCMVHVASLFPSLIPTEIVILYQKFY